MNFEKTHKLTRSRNVASSQTAITLLSHLKTFGWLVLLARKIPIMQMRFTSKYFILFSLKILQILVKLDFLEKNSSSCF